MSGAAPDRNFLTGAAPDVPSAAKLPWWKKVAEAYRRRPLLYGFFTLLGLTLLVARLSPLMSSGEHTLGGRFGTEETATSRLLSIADNLHRMDEFGQMPYTEMLRDTLNPWIRQLKPPGAWEPDPYLFEIFPRFRTATHERQRLGSLIDELQKKLAGKGTDKGTSAKGAGPIALPDAKPKGKETAKELAEKDRAAIVEERNKLQALDANMSRVRGKLIQELSDQSFSLEDAFIIEGTAWLRDISGRLRERLAARSRGAVDSLALAQELFDWTVRNVTVEEKEVGSELLWESLLWGRGPSATRAWIFIELCRQQGLDAAMLGYRDPKDPGNQGQLQFQFWIPGVILSQDGSPPDLYLFDHRWGVPIPGPGGKGVATLTQAAGSPEILAQLDGVRNYPQRSSELQEVVAMVDVSPHLVSRRMQVLEDELRSVNRGADRLVLTVELGKLAARLQKIKGISRIEPWPWPSQCELNSRQVAGEARRMRFALFNVKGVEDKGQKNEMLKKEAPFQELAVRKADQAPEEIEDTLEEGKRKKRQQEVTGFLWRGRMLHFRGVFADADNARKENPQDRPAASVPSKGAPNVYQTGRISDHELDELRREMEMDVKTLEKTRQERKNLSPAEVEILGLKIASIENQLRQMAALRLERQFVRLLATGWIGHVAYERGDYADAAAYFRHLLDAEAKALDDTLKGLPEKPATDAEKRLRQYVDDIVKPTLAISTAGATYNFARALEAAGRHAEAIDAYRDDKSDQRPGSLYRARRLEQQLAGHAKSGDAKEADAKAKAKPEKTPESKQPEGDKPAETKRSGAAKSQPKTSAPSSAKPAGKE